MALDFPASPSVGQTYTFSGRTWEWNGTGWQYQVITNTGGWIGTNQIDYGLITGSLTSFADYGGLV